MTDILFYHLTVSTLEQALPALLEKSLERGWKVVVQAGNEDRRDALDNHLWTYRDDSFLAHGVEGGSHDADQPVLLTIGEDNANNAQIRFLVDGAETDRIDGYERIVFMFDGHDEPQVIHAREQWKALKDKAKTQTYWQQTETGGWERKA